MAKGFKKLGGEFQVNTYTTSTQDDTAVTVLEGGGFVVVWESFAQDGSSGGVFGQRYDTAGNPLGLEFQVNTFTTGSQDSANVTALADGGFVVVWESDGQDGDGNGIYGKRYDANGVVLLGEFQINSTTAGGQRDPIITGLKNGGFVVVWEAPDQDGDLLGIYGQQFDAWGNALGPEFQVNTYATSSQANPWVTALDTGGFVVVWDSFGQDGSATGVYGQVYDGNGAPTGSEFQINSHTPDGQQAPIITSLADGGFVVVWVSSNQDGSNEGVFGQRYNAAGLTVGAEFQANTETASSQTNPDATDLADGGFIVTWASNLQDGDNNGIYGQRYDAAGHAVGGEFRINTTTVDSQYQPSIAGFEDGSFVVSWESDGQDGSGDSVQGQLFQAQWFGTFMSETLKDTAGANWMDGQGGDDILRGLQGNDKLFGSNGDDRLEGGIGKDVLNGGYGKDKLKGGDGRDKLEGGRGNDTLTGGAGKDIFFFYSDNYGKDKITDFQDDFDTFKLDEALWGGGMTKQQVINTYASVDGGDIVFDFGSDELRLKGFTDLTELKDDMAFI